MILMLPEQMCGIMIEQKTEIRQVHFKNKVRISNSHFSEMEFIAISNVLLKNLRKVIQLSFRLFWWNS